MTPLSAIEFENRVDFRGMISKCAGGSQLLAFVWVNRNRSYSLQLLALLVPKGTMQRVDISTNADPDQVELIIPQLKAANFNYKTCPTIGRQNRCR